MPPKRPENFFKIFYHPIAAPFVFFPYTEKGPPFLRGEPFPELSHENNWAGEHPVSLQP